MSRRDRQGCLEALTRVLVNPCAGTRLVDTAAVDDETSGIRWSDFCKLDCARYGRRIVYRFVPGEGHVMLNGRVIKGPLVLIESVGPHKRRGDPDDVYTVVKRAHASLPDDAGHAKPKQRQPCCEASSLAAEDRMDSTIEAEQLKLLR